MKQYQTCIDFKCKCFVIKNASNFQWNAMKLRQKKIEKERKEKKNNK